jgi:hypothetical protein
MKYWAAMLGMFLSVDQVFGAGDDDMRRGGGASSCGNTTVSHKWYHDEDDYIFVESWILCALIPAAYLFEHLLHEVDHAFFANHHDDTEHKENFVENTILEQQHGHDGSYKISTMHASKKWQELFARTNTELTVLGLLALCVWIGTQAELWPEFVPPKLDRAYSPQTWLELHTVVDDVHMHLFLAMCLHFFVVAAVVWYSTWVQHAMQDLEIFKAAHMTQKRQKRIEMAAANAAATADEKWDLFPKVNTTHHDLEGRRVNWMAPPTILRPLHFITGDIKYFYSFMDRYHALRADFIQRAARLGQRHIRKHIWEEQKHFDFSLYAK